ncbi:hypothetical protein THAOC_37446, partial [Thalassiosira oceanica]
MATANIQVPRGVWCGNNTRRTTTKRYGLHVDHVETASVCSGPMPLGRRRVLTPMTVVEKKVPPVAIGVHGSVERADLSLQRELEGERHGFGKLRSRRFQRCPLRHTDRGSAYKTTYFILKCRCERHFLEAPKLNDSYVVSLSASGGLALVSTKRTGILIARKISRTPHNTGQSARWGNVLTNHRRAMLRVTPVYGSPSPSAGDPPSSSSSSDGPPDWLSSPSPSCTLVEYAGMRVLLNVGWDEGLVAPPKDGGADEKSAAGGERSPAVAPNELPDADAVLVCDSTLGSLGGLPGTSARRP